MSVRFQRPPAGTLTPNNEKDPLPFYYKRSTGWLYQHRLQMGLDMLPVGRGHLLEVGVGSGILVPTLTNAYARYTGTDLVLAPGLQRFVAPTCQAEFVAADLLADNALPPEAFDAIVCFSVLEHIADSEGAAIALARALKPGGTLVTGYPMVSRSMTRLFDIIGYKNIYDDHVSAPKKIEAALARHLRPQARAAFPPGATVSTALYQCRAWTR